MNISIIGTGYVGLVTGACFAEMGNSVHCVDNDRSKIDNINNDIIPIYEPGLQELISINTKKGRLIFTADISYAVENTKFCFIAVGTPSNEDGSADLTSVLAVAEQIGKHMTSHLYVVDKSTVPVGTAEKVREKIQNQLDLRNSQLTFDVISNPEFLKEGDAIKDCMSPDRIIVGIDNDDALIQIKNLYRPFFRTSERFVSMDIKSAEMTKYAANAMLATKISFINEMANICENVGADINKVRIGIGSDSRIGYQFIYPGCGYGGSCFPKDVQALIKTGQESNYRPEILAAVELVNSKQKLKLVEKIFGRFSKCLKGKTFAIWGISFKPNTDDIRQASSLVIIDALIKAGARVKAYDPQANKELAKIYGYNNPSVVLCDNKYEALEQSEAIILVTEWKEFRSPDFKKIKSLLINPVIFDGRNQYDQNELLDYGFEYYQIGVQSNYGK